MQTISITVIEPGKTPTPFILQLGKAYRLGRDADIVLEDQRCSRLHVCLKVGQGNKIEFADLESKNGTYFNGERRHRGTLLPGDLLMIGRTRVLVAPTTTYPAVTQGEGIERPDYVR